MQHTYTTCLRIVFEVCSICHILYLSTQYVSSTFEIAFFVLLYGFFFFLHLYILNKYFIIMYLMLF